MTQEQRARLVEVMKGELFRKWDIPPSVIAAMVDDAIAAAERAGFRIEAPGG